jgi:hypothetical protein
MFFDYAKIYVLVMDVFIVIRSSKERTISACYQSIIDQGISSESIALIEEVPFSKAVMSTFKLGLKSGAKWTLGLDADVIYRTNMLREQITFADQLSDNYFMIQGMVLDKVNLIKRNTGGHLFRTSLLPIALKNFSFVLDFDRPEGTLNEKMKSLGFPYYNWDKLLAIHDYEQYYIDLFRKGYAQAIKHEGQSKQLAKLWAQFSIKDQDYLFIYLGYLAGLNIREKLGIQELRTIGKDILSTMGIQEKCPINSPIDVEEIIRDFTLHPTLYQHQNEIINACSVSANNLGNLPPYLFSRILQKLGVRPEHISGIYK